MNIPFTEGKKARLIFGALPGLPIEGSVGVVLLIDTRFIVMLFDGEEFQRVVPRQWLSPITEDETNARTVPQEVPRHRDLRSSEPSLHGCGAGC